MAVATCAPCTIRIRCSQKDTANEPFPQPLIHPIHLCASPHPFAARILVSRRIHDRHFVDRPAAGKPPASPATIRPACEDPFRRRHDSMALHPGRVSPNLCAPQGKALVHRLIHLFPLPRNRTARTRVSRADDVALALRTASSHSNANRETPDMNLTVETEQEADGRWIAEIPEFPGALAVRVLAERFGEEKATQTRP